MTPFCTRWGHQRYDVPLFTNPAALFLRSRVPTLIPAPTTSYEWLEFTGHRRSHHCPKSSLSIFLSLLSTYGLNFDTMQVPCVAEPERLGTLSRCFRMHITPSDYIVSVIAPGTYIVPYMMQMAILHTVRSTPYALSRGIKRN